MVSVVVNELMSCVQLAYFVEYFEVGTKHRLPKQDVVKLGAPLLIIFILYLNFQSNFQANMTSHLINA